MSAAPEAGLIAAQTCGSREEGARAKTHPCRINSLYSVYHMGLPKITLMRMENRNSTLGGVAEGERVTSGGLSILAATKPVHEPLEQRARHDAFDEGDEEGFGEQAADEGDGDFPLARTSPD